MIRYIFPIVCLCSLFLSSKTKDKEHILKTSLDTLQYPEEKHFKNLRQLTFGGSNAEAYFSFDGKYLIFQKTNPDSKDLQSVISNLKAGKDPVASLPPPSNTPEKSGKAAVKDTTSPPADTSTR